MRRGSREAPVSLFSFQDVMVSTIGVTLLIILVLLLLAGKKAAAIIETAIETVDQAEATPTAPAPEAIDDPTHLQLELLTLDDRIEELELLLDEAREAAQLSRTQTLLDTDEAVQAAKQRQVAALAGELEELKSRRRVTYLLDKEDSDRTPLVIELGGGRAVLGSGGDDEAALALHNSNPTQLANTVAAWIDALPDRNQRVLVFVVRPSGVNAWHELEAVLPRWSNDGIGHGLDLIAESWSTSGLLPGSKETP